MAYDRRQSCSPLTFLFSKIDVGPDSAESLVRGRIEVAIGSTVLPANDNYGTRIAVGQRVWEDLGNVVTGYNEAGPVTTNLSDVTLCVGINEIRAIDPNILSSSEFLNSAVGILIDEVSRRSR